MVCRLLITLSIIVLTPGILSFVLAMFANGYVDHEDTEDIQVSETLPTITSFKKMGLKPELLHGIYEYGVYSFLYNFPNFICLVLTFFLALT